MKLSGNMKHWVNIHHAKKHLHFYYIVLKVQTHLVGGFNPSENIPQHGKVRHENKQYLSCHHLVILKHWKTLFPNRFPNCVRFTRRLRQFWRVLCGAWKRVSKSLKRSSWSSIKSDLMPSRSICTCIGGLFLMRIWSPCFVAFERTVSTCNFRCLEHSPS